MHEKFLAAMTDECLAEFRRAACAFLNACCLDNPKRDQRLYENGLSLGRLLVYLMDIFGFSWWDYIPLDEQILFDSAVEFYASRYDHKVAPDRWREMLVAAKNYREAKESC